MEWQDVGLVLSVRPHGETSAVVSLFTREHGRHKGLMRGARSRGARAVLQPGNLVEATWRARLEEHLGHLTAELARGAAANFFDRPERLAAIVSACALVESSIAERDPHPDLFMATLELLASLDEADWAQTYVRWELALLGALGFGLDLSRCAATGSNDDLAFVSPKSARAVSLSAGEPYRDKLLPLPGFLTSRRPAVRGEIAQGLALTGYFLDRHVFAPHERTLPDARERLAAGLADK